jgi:hypothetical protein
LLPKRRERASKLGESSGMLRPDDAVDEDTGVTMVSGSSAPGSTISSTSAMVVRAAVAKAGLKFREPPRYVRLPWRSARAARTIATSARIARSSR